jgi:hypothetical protein
LRFHFCEVSLEQFERKLKTLMTGYNFAFRGNIHASARGEELPRSGILTFSRSIQREIGETVRTVEEEARRKGAKVQKKKPAKSSRRKSSK